MNHGEAIHITKKIFQVEGSQLKFSEDAAIYLINFYGHAALVDAGCGDALDRLIANIRSCGLNLEQIEYLLITHCHYDHTGGTKALKDLPKCQIVAHELDAPFLEQDGKVVTAAMLYFDRLPCGFFSNQEICNIYNRPIFLKKHRRLTIPSKFEIVILIHVDICLLTKKRGWSFGHTDIKRTQQRNLLQLVAKNKGQGCETTEPPIPRFNSFSCGGLFLGYPFLI